MFDHVNFGRGVGSSITDLYPDQKGMGSVITDMSPQRRAMGSDLTDLWVRPMTDLAMDQRGPGVKRMGAVGDEIVIPSAIGIVAIAVTSLLSGVLFAIGFSFGSSIRSIRVTKD